MDYRAWAIGDEILCEYCALDWEITHRVELDDPKVREAFNATPLILGHFMPMYCDGCHQAIWRDPH